MKRLNHKPGSDPRRLAPDQIETYTVGINDFAEGDGTPLLVWLQGAMPQRKRTTVKELLRHGQVMVNGTPTTQALQPVSVGDEVRVNLARPFHVFRHRRLHLVYEDEDILVVNKGYGLLSIATDKKGEETVYSIMRDYVKWGDRSKKVFIVHRLDRDTSGLMMLAKSAEAKEAMQHNWNNMVLERRYVCVVEGDVEGDEGTIRNWLKENSRHEMYAVDRPEEGAQLAVTRWKVIGRGHGRTMLEVTLDTGRKNQIRAHMSGMGHSIVGDRRYGAAPSPIHRLALHAQTLRFAHPMTRKYMDFSTPIPESFRKLLN